MDIEEIVLWSIAILCVGALFAVCFGMVSNAKEFRAVCEKAGGAAVHDGMKYQCIKLGPTT